MKAIKAIQNCIETHRQWAVFFERNPGKERAEFHRDCFTKIKEYKEAIYEIEQLQAELKDLKRVLELGYENFSTWLRMNKNHICMGRTQRQQFTEILEALKGDKT